MERKTFYFISVLLTIIFASCSDNICSTKMNQYNNENFIFDLKANDENNFCKGYNLAKIYNSKTFSIYGQEISGFETFESELNKYAYSLKKISSSVTTLGQFDKIFGENYFVLEKFREELGKSYADSLVTGVIFH